MSGSSKLIIYNCVLDNYSKTRVIFDTRDLSFLAFEQYKWIKATLI